MTQLAEEKRVHLSNFERFEREANGDGMLPWLDELRRSGMARFDEVGFPSATDEHWRHTQLAPIVRTRFDLARGGLTHAAADRAHEFAFGSEAISELVFINGYFNADLSRLGKLPRGVDRPDSNRSPLDRMPYRGFAGSPRSRSDAPDW